MGATVQQVINQFTDRAIELALVNPLDRTYTINRLLAILNLQEAAESAYSEKIDLELVDYMDAMVDYAREQGLIDSSQSDKEILEAEIMDLVTPLPSELNRVFWDLYNDMPEEATDYFYSLSQANDYIKTRDIARNIAFTASSDYGDLEITINLSKPEKDPKDIAKALIQPSVHYPKCALCMENEGYRGHVNHAARQNHRIVRFLLGENYYGFQYSPYSYYNEHSIFLNEDHIPMAVDRKCFQNILEIVSIFPHYFVGSNADLPRVGGSILSHDHYQGGRHAFPMEKAQAYQQIELSQYPELRAELVEWPMSVIRLRHTSRQVLVEAATYILDHWRDYSDPSLDILAYSGEDEERHNTITPIARYKDGQFELDLVLRNNRVNEAFPDGIFHPHQDVHHIKKENIGLIEVMGLAVLPPRLVPELDAVKAYLLGSIPLEEVTTIHQGWAEDIEAREVNITSENIDSVIEVELASKFQRVLEDAGVYKLDASGRAGFMRFVDSLNE